MKRALEMALLATCIGFSATTRAQSGEAVVKSKGCLNCHAIDQKKAGPSFKDVAAKNKGNSGAEAQLAAKLKGGTGHPKVQASDGELKAVVQYVLKQ
jgi:cytochrome c